MLSRLVITFLPRSKRLLISWLQSPSAVILEPPKNKVSSLSTYNINHISQAWHRWVEYICVSWCSKASQPLVGTHIHIHEPNGPELGGGTLWSNTKMGMSALWRREHSFSKFWKVGKNWNGRGFPAGPGVKTLSSNAGDTGSIPGQGTKIPHAMGQLERSPCTAAKEAHMLS